MCSRVVYDYVRGVVVCEDTGEVIEENLVDMGPEWRAYSPEERLQRVRVGSPPSVDMDITTYIDEDWSRLSKTQRSVLSAGMARNLSIARGIIRRACRILKLPKNVEERAVKIYMRALELGTIRNMDIHGSAAASIILACRFESHPTPTRDILRAVQTRYPISFSCLERIYMALHADGIKVPPYNHRAFFERLARSLNLSPEVEAKAREILELAEREGLTGGRVPHYVAGACIYVAAKMLGVSGLSVRKIAKACDSVPHTIREIYREVIKMLARHPEYRDIAVKIAPPDILHKGDGDCKHQISLKQR